MSLQCVVLEDQAPARRVLESYLARLEGFAHAGSAAVPAAAAALLARRPVDLLFLDLGLPQQDGFAFLETLSPPPVVVVTTAFGGRALEGFTHGVADYLVKPFSFERFKVAAERARLALRARQDASILTVPLDRGRREFVSLGDVTSLSADGDYVIIRTLGGRLYTLGPLASWLERLPSPPFVRVHRSHALNARHVTALEGRCVRVAGETLPVSATHVQALERALARRD